MIKASIAALTLVLSVRDTPPMVILPHPFAAPVLSPYHVPITPVPAPGTLYTPPMPYNGFVVSPYHVPIMPVMPVPQQHYPQPRSMPYVDR